MDVSLAGGRIAAITPTASPTGPASPADPARSASHTGPTSPSSLTSPSGRGEPGVTTIDAAGKFVVPGFLEMHTHVLGEKDTARDLKLLLDAGVTGFRLMAGSDKLLKERRDGTLPWSASTSDDTPELLAMPGAVLNPANAGTVKAALTTVREQHAAGADFIKAALVSSEVFFAAQTEARPDGTWHCPTLIRERTSELSDAAEFRDDPNLSLMDDKTVSGWRAAAGKFGALPADIRATYRDAYDLQLRLTKLLDDAGVKLLAGSDSCGAVWVVPGYSLHQEFDELSRAGLSPLRVLQTVTLDAAEFLGRTTTLGTVEPGKQADLVLLEANPLDSVANLHGLAGVVRAGRFHSAA
jgi:hypothetical protein